MIFLNILVDIVHFGWVISHSNFGLRMMSSMSFKAIMIHKFSLQKVSTNSSPREIFHYNGALFVISSFSQSISVITGDPFYVATLTWAFPSLTGPVSFSKMKGCAGPKNEESRGFGSDIGSFLVLGLFLHLFPKKYVSNSNMSLNLI